MSNSTVLNLRPLEQELRSSSAGRHNLRRPHVAIDSIGFAVVSKHEGFHDELLFHTSFGEFQRAVAVIPAPDSRGKQLLASWLALTVEKSRMAHETYATYLTIKSFAKDKESELLDLHPAEYQEHFERLAACIDEALQSSYLQFVVGKALVACAFSGRLLLRVSTREELANPIIHDYESPDLRLQAILENYTERFSGPVCAAVDACSSRLINDGALPKDFVPYSETSWISLNPEKAKLLEKKLMASLHQVFRGVAENHLQLPMDNYVNIQQGPSALAQLLIDMAGHEFVEVKESIRVTEDELKRLRLGEVLIENESASPDDDWTKIDLGEFNRCLRVPNVSITKKLYAAHDEIEWRLLVFDHESICRYRFSDETLHRALYIHRPFNLSQGNHSVLQTVLFGVQSRDSFDKMYERYEDLVVHAEHVTKYNSIFWYMGGNYVEWIDALVSHGDVRLYVLTLILDGSEGMESYMQRGPLRNADIDLNAPQLPARLIILKPAAGLGLGYHVRLIPGFEATKLLMEGPMQNAERFPEAERGYLRSVTSGILNALFRTWRRI